MSFNGLSPIRFGSVSMTTATLGPNDPKVGDRATVGGNSYIFVYNAGGQEIKKGYGAVVSGVSGYSVTVSSTVSLLVGVGVAVASIATGYYGWLQTYGFAQVHNTSAAVAKGEGLSLAGDGLFVNTSGITGPVYGKAMEAITATGASGTAFINFGGG